MQYISVAEAAKKWRISERSVRSYCAQGRVEGAFLTGKTWNIPDTAGKPLRISRQEAKETTLLQIMQDEKARRYGGGIYQKTQVEFAFNSGVIGGSRLSQEQVHEIFTTNSVNTRSDSINIDDIVETANHFRCVDLIIDRGGEELTEKFICRLHAVLKTGSSDSRRDWSAAGSYKKHPNVIEGMETVLPENVPAAMKTLLDDYNDGQPKNLEDIVRFHMEFEKIHPFQTGNGTVGRLIMFKECLRYNIVPFVIGYQWKPFYYRGFKEWGGEHNFLLDTCLAAQDKYRAWLEYFRPEQKV